MAAPEGYEFSDLTIGLYCPREVHDSLMNDLSELLSARYAGIAWQLSSRENLVEEEEVEGLEALRQEVETRLRHAT